MNYLRDHIAFFRPPLFFLAIFLCVGAVAYAVPLRDSGSLYYVSTIAGTGKKGYVDGAALKARFNWPTGVAVAPDGTVFVADYSNKLLREISVKGQVSTFAGDLRGGFADATGASALFRGPDNIAFDDDGNLIVGDADNFRVRMISPEGVVSTIAGSGRAILMDGEASTAAFAYPTGVDVDKDGTIYVADRRTHTVRKIFEVEGKLFVKTIGGNGIPGFANGHGIKTNFREPVSVAVGDDGSVFVSDSGNNAIRKIDKDGVITTLAGGSMPGYRDAAGTRALFAWPTGITMDGQGGVFVCDSKNNKIRRVTAKGVVTTVAGKLQAGSTDGPGLRASFNFPTGIALDRSGNIYVADSGNNKIRKITRGKRMEAGLRR